jgi:hypothetical protein
MSEKKRLLTSGPFDGKKVPDWLYGECCCGNTIAGSLWIMNLVCCIFHTGLAIASLSVGCSYPAGAGSCGSPLLTLYGTKLTWQGGADPLVPTYEKMEGGLNLTWMTTCFFLLSALAHGLICVGNYTTGLADYEEKNYNHEITWSPIDGGWYWAWIQECKQPLRWVEYSFSASLMIITISVASGVTHVYMIWSIFTLMWCTMCFGYYTEVTSKAEPTGSERPQKWIWRATKAGWGNYLRWKAWRLAAHVLGYVPYTCVWVILMHSFYSNTEGGGPPDFVYAIVWGQFALFTGFGATQLLNQWREDGPWWYWRGELSYLVLSLVSKGVLGLTLISNVFFYSTFADAATAR